MFGVVIPQSSAGGKLGVDSTAFGGKFGGTSFFFSSLSGTFGSVIPQSSSFGLSLICFSPNQNFANRLKNTKRQTFIPDRFLKLQFILPVFFFVSTLFYPKL